MIILSPDLVGFSCILILYGGFDVWPINTEFLGGKVDIMGVGDVLEHCISL